ncbi:hypothetical protein IPN35_03600 [Candidatus Peregrinibacteria bacterium]|nr:MAG: hypothetical protein IPN35_03600 [Candidatus Peregrinibacteria bacterium]
MISFRNFFGIFLVCFGFFITENVQAYEGGGTFSAVLSKNTFSQGEEGTADIFLDTSGLLLGSNEHLETIGVSLLFSPDILEVTELGFSGSAFPTPYLSDFDNSAGRISFVRAKSDDPISELAFIGSISFRVKEDAQNGSASFLFRPGENSVLLDDVSNSDILQSSSDGIFEVSGTQNNAQNIGVIKNAKLFLIAENPNISVGEETIVTIYINTGDSSNIVTSTDFSVLFPKDIVAIPSSMTDASGGVFSGAGLNMVHSDTGKIDLLLYSSGGIQASKGKVASFLVRRIASGEASFLFSSNSAVYANDVDNTDVLENTGGLTLSAVAESSPSGGTSGGSTSGGGSSGGSRRNVSLSPQSKGDSSLPACSVVKDFSGKALPNGKFSFSWSLPSDKAVESLELFWESKDDSGSVAIPLVETLTFPGKDMKPGTAYSFFLRSLGTDCYKNETVPISVTKGSVSSGGGSSTSEKILPPAPILQKASANPYAGNIASAKIPTTPAGGPVALFSLILISIAGFFFLSSVRRRQKKEQGIDA